MYICVCIYIYIYTYLTEHRYFNKLKKVTPSVAKFFVCSKCEKATNGAQEVQPKVMCDEVETVKGF